MKWAASPGRLFYLPVNCCGAWVCSLPPLCHPERSEMVHNADRFTEPRDLPFAGRVDKSMSNARFPYETQGKHLPR